MRVNKQLRCMRFRPTDRDPLCICSIEDVQAVQIYVHTYIYVVRYTVRSTCTYPYVLVYFLVALALRGQREVIASWSAVGHIRLREGLRRRG